MRNLLQGIRCLSRRQKLAVGLMVAVIVLTWLALCLVVASSVAP